MPGQRAIDGEPLLALRAGNPAPFEAFVREHSATFLVYFRQNGRTLARAEDLAQEVFVRLFRAARRYEPRERFAAYCFRVARNVLVDDARRVGRQPVASALDEQELSAAAVEPGAELLRSESDQRVGELLAHLPTGQREVVELAILGELDYAEIASLLGIPVGTVKSRMFYALRSLRTFAPRSVLPLAAERGWS
jgi:RNA polymerase sigma-70 factor (ECF subfamily)